MGYEARANPNCRAEGRGRRAAESNLRQVLAMFPDRQTFEEWATNCNLTDELRAHLEQYLPPGLQAEGTV